MSQPFITIIGAGHMGGSLISGLIQDGYPSHQLCTTDPSEEKRDYFKRTFHIEALADNIKATQLADVIIFAVKPQQLATIAKELSSTIQQRQSLVLSVAAGIRLANLKQWLGSQTAIVRVMPNTPALVRSGASALFANPNVSSAQRNTAESIMRSVGITVWLPNENLLDTVTALSGSGPAYFFQMMNALQQAATDMGLAPETARLLTLQTALGAAHMALETNTSLTELQHQVTSPGGTTEQAILVLEKHQIAQIYQQALHAAKQRAEELANQIGEKS